MNGEEKAFGDKRIDVKREGVAADLLCKIGICCLTWEVAPHNNNLQSSTEMLVIDRYQLKSLSTIVN